MRIKLLSLAIACSTAVMAQTTLSLDSCRAMALNNNRQLAIGKVQKDIAQNVRKIARTQYLPKVTAMGGYEYMSKEVSILSNAQKGVLGNLGTLLTEKTMGAAGNLLTELVQGQMISPEMAQAIGQKLAEQGGNIAAGGNSVGQAIADAFRTDTHNIFAGSIMLTQPVFMGGMLKALNNMADIGEKMAATKLEHQQHETLYEIDHIYWLIVSLRQKQELAKSFNKLVCHLDEDVKKMIKEGVATRADGLKVAVKVNESEMALTQAENGIALAKMLLCQQCGLPLDSQITLEDEGTKSLALVDNAETVDTKTAIEMRSETKLLEHAVGLTQEGTRIARAGYMPQILLTGGYMISNPNVFNSFEKKFSGVWNVGVVLRMPVWNWFETAYKIRASKATTVMAEYQLADAKEKMELQINQNKFKVSEANKRLAMAQKNIKSAEENLRCADLGFKEGVISSTDVIAAQTAWFMAQSQKIDAEIEVRMNQLALKKSLGAM